MIATRPTIAGLDHRKRRVRRDHPAIEARLAREPDRSWAGA
jgi:hypothetical protein